VPTLTPTVSGTRTRSLTGLLATAAVLALAACTVTGATTGQGGGGSAPPGQAGAQLATLTVAGGLSMAGYSRDRFHIWAAQGGNCDTRDVVLKRDGQGVAADGNCKITKGSWTSPYNLKSYSDPLQLDIDHVVPLANAWKSGAKSWTDVQRTDFANDLTRPQLLAVDASDNRSKGDQDPSTWKPPNQAFWCTYATDWITVKAYWKLTVTAAEKAALTTMLDSCT